MTTAETVQHIVLDDRGIAWIKDTSLKVVELVREHVAYGWSADELREQHPYLTLGQIHSSLAFYYDHASDFETQLQAADREYARLRAQTGESAAQSRLRSLMREK